MALKTARLNSLSGKMGKRLWKSPVMEALAIRTALGAAPGAKCDKYGSLSTGTGCGK